MCGDRYEPSNDVGGNDECHIGSVAADIGIGERVRCDSRRAKRESAAGGKQCGGAKEGRAGWMKRRASAKRQEGGEGDDAMERSQSAGVGKGDDGMVMVMVYVCFLSYCCVCFPFCSEQKQFPETQSGCWR